MGGMNRLGTKDIVDAEIISEETVSLADGDNEFIKWVARKADQLTSGNRGSWVTEALILADYVKDKDRLRAAYKNAEPEIDAYFEQVDIQQMINDAGPSVQERVQIGLTDIVKNNVPGFLAGSLLTAGTILAIKKYKNS
jgi:hypothetical protein